nr:uncharacterized protein LOC109184674 [Ipomoea batatas]
MSTPRVHRFIEDNSSRSERFHSRLSSQRTSAVAQLKPSFTAWTGQWAYGASPSSVMPLELILAVADYYIHEAALSRLATIKEREKLIIILDANITGPRSQSVQSPTTSSVRPQPGLRFSELWLLKSRHPAMVSCPVLAGSKVLPFGVFLPNGNAVSFRHCHKHLEDTFPAKNLHSNACFKLNKTHFSSSLSLQKPSERFSLLPLKCSSSHSTAKTDDGIMFRNSSVESIKSNFSELTPFLNSLRNHSVELMKSNFSQLTLFLESLKNFSQLTPFDLCK